MSSSDSAATPLCSEYFKGCNGVGTLLEGSCARISHQNVKYILCTLRKHCMIGHHLKLIIYIYMYLHLTIVIGLGVSLN